jgi:hypothetical protein
MSCNEKQISLVSSKILGINENALFFSMLSVLLVAVLILLRSASRRTR